MTRANTRFDRALPWAAFLHDVVMAGLAFILAMYLRVGSEAFGVYRGPMLQGLPIFMVSAAVAFRLIGLYRGLWRYASGRDLMSILKAVLLALLIFMPVMFVKNRLELFPRQVLLILPLVLMVFLAGPRLLYRMAKDRTAPGAVDRSRRIPVLLIGAGDGAELFIRAMTGNAAHPYRVVGVLDDQKRNLAGRQIREAKILGHADDLTAVIERLTKAGDRPQRLIVTRPAADLDGAAMRRLVEQAQSLGLAIARLPALTEFRDAVADGRLKLQPVAVTDLLGRPQVVHDTAALHAMVKGRRILVTGAGGTIGGELTRQLAALAPARLALVEHGEFALYNIGQTLGAEYPGGAEHPGLDFVTHLGDIRDRDRIMALFADEKPDIVFHAAALKHLPLAEINPSECVLTNAIGSRNVADAARAAGAKAMVMISTDKAVHPSSIMGLTKRIAETYCQAVDVDGDQTTRYVTVRFGNVLGSTGSVVPLFERQLAAGGPLTVTHPDVERYFMTCGEAVQLVLQTAAHAVAGLGERGRIFVLDMGEPVKIVDLARQMIRLAGLEPGRDIQIKFTGLRNGEKLTERLSDEDEPLVPTQLSGILTAAPQIVDVAVVNAFLDRLREAAKAGHGTTELTELLDQARRNAMPEPESGVRRRLRPV
ncbi:MAG TPA: nucleoside-diphosphate sugar epimerase/dehydratase [Alphaproteobacteria bacterium]|jgi:O-antigen biosynthesis protein WbqV|nr:nucleoside-diphosphate sugar epimerase/dehydratase [Alphaproteobacteria bacterium]